MKLEQDSYKTPWAFVPFAFAIPTIEDYNLYAPEVWKKKSKETISRSAINAAEDKGCTSDPMLSMDEAGKRWSEAVPLGSSV
jgi:hypothetical protein